MQRFLDFETIVLFAVVFWWVLISVRKGTSIWWYLGRSAVISGIIVAVLILVGVFIAYLKDTPVNPFSERSFFPDWAVMAVSLLAGIGFLGFVVYVVCRTLWESRQQVRTGEITKAEHRAGLYIGGICLCVVLGAPVIFSMAMSAWLIVAVTVFMGIGSWILIIYVYDRGDRNFKCDEESKQNENNQRIE